MLHSLVLELTKPLALQVNCSISGNIVIRVLQYRGTGGGYLQLTFLNINGGIDSVLIGASQANVSTFINTCVQQCFALVLVQQRGFGADSATQPTAHYR